MSGEQNLSSLTNLGESLQGCVQQFSRCVVELLQDDGGRRLEEVRRQLGRMGGLCRFLGVRRAALFCTELDAILVFSASADSNATRDSLRALIARSAVLVQHFLARLSLSISDAQFDMVLVNELRGARGKGALSVHAPPGRTTTSEQFLLPDIVLCTMERISALQAGLLRFDEPSFDEELEGNRTQWLELASLLDLLGMQFDLRCRSAALIHLELHFNHLLAYRQPITAAELATAPLMSATDYLLASSRRSLCAVLESKFAPLGNLFAEIAGTAGRDRQGVDILRAVTELKLQCRTFHAFLNDRILCAAEGMAPLLLASDQLCGFMRCGVNVLSSEINAIQGNIFQKSALLLLRLSLLLQKMLCRSDPFDSQRIPGLCQECTRLILLWQHRQHVHMVNLHGVDSELLVCAGKEISRYRNILHASLNNCSTAQGIHYISDSLCTAVSKLSILLASVGEIPLYVIVEELREGLVHGLERQQRASIQLQKVLASLCTILERPLPIMPKQIQEQPIADDNGWQILSDQVRSCVSQIQWSFDGDESSVAVACNIDEINGGRNNLSVEQLPGFLAGNIRELLFCADELSRSAAQPEQFDDFNRRLIVELRMLATGARALHVHRVARLSVALAEVHQALAMQSTRPGMEREVPLTLLITAHRQLRSGLNQAAARQEVSSNRDTVAALYRWLEEGSAQNYVESETEGLAIFLRETEELTLSIEDNVNRCEEDFDVGTLLHNLHTLKGNARTFGHELVSALCHQCEQMVLNAGHLNPPVSAIAESGRLVVYPASAGHAVDAGQTQLRKLVEELRTAVDLLNPSGIDSKGRKVCSGVNAEKLSRTPLASASERGVVVPARSLQRMSELALMARTGCRAMNDLLLACRQDFDSARVSLLADLMAEQQRCTAQLDEEIAGSRRISFARLTPRLHRLAARQGNLLDRQLRFRVLNDDVCGDRLLVESLVAPLEHLLRNAIDHGIETVPERRARGKSDCGTITLALQEQADSLVLELTDDGAGIDPDALLLRAKRLSLSVDLQALPEERLRWIFLPGFSTREIATEHAGHGIGLAMVNDTVIELGGRVEVESNLGQGCRFRIVVPGPNSP